MIRYILPTMTFYHSPIAARLYDLQHEDDPELELEKELFLREIAASKGPALDLGCGTGRILLPALEQGLDVWGCDASEAFLKRLIEEGERLNLRPRNLVWCCELEKLEEIPEKDFPLAFAAFRTFDHLSAPGSRGKFLASVHKCLEPGGRLILNLANPHPMDLQEAVGQKILMRDDLEDPDSGQRIVWWGATCFEPGENLIHQTFEYQFLSTTGQVKKTYSFPFTMRWTPPEEMAELAEEAGFQVAERWGGFEKETFEIGTGDAVWELRKEG